MVEKKTRGYPDHIAKEIENHGIDIFNFRNGLIYFPKKFCVKREQDGWEIKLNLTQNWILIKLVENLLLNQEKFVPYSELVNINDAKRHDFVRKLRKIIDPGKRAKESILVTHHVAGLSLSIPGRQNHSYQSVGITHTARLMRTEP